MSLWSRLEQALWTGPVAKDYGVISEGKHGKATRKVSALLAHRDSKDRFVIKTTYKALFAASAQYLALDRDGALRLKAALDDALQAMH